MTPQNKTAVVIPARLGSTRFPNKMLLQVEPKTLGFKGRTLIERVFHQVSMVMQPSDIYVATDSQEIADLFPDNAIMTSVECENGTARIAEAADQLPEYDNFINVQGDLIDVPVFALTKVKKMLEDGRELVTVCAPMNEEDQSDPNTVKCIQTGNNVHWFCRAALPYGMWHIGLYGYSRRNLRSYPNLLSYSEEKKESLEQLRWLQNGYKMTITVTNDTVNEINTPEDLAKWQQTPQNYEKQFSTTLSTIKNTLKRFSPFSVMNTSMRNLKRLFLTK